MKYTDVFLLLAIELFSSQREDQESREGGIFPASHQIASLQSKVGLVLLLHDHQASVSCSFPGHILVSSKG